MTDASTGSRSISYWLAFVALAVCAVLLISKASSNTNSDRSPVQKEQNARQNANPAQMSAVARQRGLAEYHLLPMAFEPNQGQTDPRVKFSARGDGYTVFLTPQGMTFAMPLAAGTSSLSKLAGQKRFAQDEEADRAQANTSANSAASLRVKMLGANSHSAITAEDRQSGITNYMIGSDPAKWHTSVPQYARVRYHDVYPGVDMLFRGAQQLEFDFVLRPDARPGQIKLDLQGADKVTTSPSGDLVLTTSGGEMRFFRPQAYQEKDGIQQPVDVHFRLNSGRQVSLVMGPYDRSRQLVIDPAIGYSTFLGGSGQDYGYGISVDSSGNAYVVGATSSTNFPGASGSPIGGGGGTFDCFLTKISFSGNLDFTTIFGGESVDIANEVAVDSTGIYVTGETSSTKFPVTSGVVQSELNRGVSTTDCSTSASSTACTDAFVVKFAPAGTSLLWATYVGGANNDIAYSVSVDNEQNVFIAGQTESSDLQVTDALPQGSSFNGGVFDGFVAELNSAASAYKIMSYIGGGGKDIATAAVWSPVNNGTVYVTGLTFSGNGATNSPPLPTTAGVFQPQCGTDGTCNTNGSGNSFSDAFLGAFHPTATSPLTYAYLTYLGGEKNDAAEDIAVDSSGNAYVTGRTGSVAFPTKLPYQAKLTAGSFLTNVFVSALNPTGTALVYSTYLGGTGGDIGLAIGLDSKANAYITGETTSTNFPVSANATQPKFGGGNANGFDSDAFVSELSFNGSALTLPFSTYLGGSGDEDINSGFLAVDPSGNIYVTGDTDSTNFPTLQPLDGSLNGGASPQPQCTFPLGGGVQTQIACPDAFVTTFNVSAFSFTPAPTAFSPASIAPGSKATSTISLTPFGGLNVADIAFSPCVVTLNGANATTAPPTCSFSTIAVASGVGTSTLTVSTTAPTSGMLAPSFSKKWTLLYAMLFPVGGMVLAGFGNRSRAKKILILAVLSLVVAGLIFLPACSGGSSSSGGNNNNNSGGGGTPAGTYTITFTATASGATSRTASLNLTVQ
jgi:hypothetical protein